MIMAEEEVRKRLRLLGCYLDEDGKFKTVNDDGELTDEGYSIGDDPGKQSDVSEALTDLVYALLEKKGMRMEYFPDPSGADGPQSFIYVSENWNTCDKLLMLIQGAGQVFPGQWSQQVMLRDGLDAGSQLPFVDRALKGDFGVVIVNPNYNFVEEGGERLAVPGSTTAADHVHTAFGYLKGQMSASFVAIVAHRHGGACAVELSNTYHDEFDKCVMSVQLVDSNHDAALHYANNRLQHISVNYIANAKPPNKGIVFKDRYTRQMSRIGEAADESTIKTPDFKTNNTEEDTADEILKEINEIPYNDGYNYQDDAIFLDIPLFSAGNKIAEWTPSAVIDFVFERIGEIMNARDLKMEVWEW